MRVSLNGYFLANPRTGSGQYARHLVEAMRDVELAVAQPEGELSNLGKLRWEQLGWPAEARRSGADVWHSPYFALPLRRSRPAVVTIHDLIPLMMPEYRGSVLVRAYTWLQVLACRSAEAILVDSECSKRDVLRLLRVPEGRVHTVYLGVDPAFKPGRTGPSPLDRPYVFYLGGQDPRKNVPALIRAFSRIAPDCPELVLAVAGQPRPAPEWVRFVDVTDADKARWYQHAELFVYPSLYEGFGLPPLEALACGCAVVCSNAGSLPEVAGNAALLVNPHNEADVAEAMRQALADPEPLRAKGPAQAAKFTWQRTAQQTLEVYRIAAGTGSTSSVLPQV